MPTPPRIEPVVITAAPEGHPLRQHIRPEGTAAAIVYGYGSATPTAIRYLGEAWDIRGVSYRPAPSTTPPS